MTRCACVKSAKSRAIETLLPEETATLIHVTDPDLLQEMEETALAVKLAVYDNRIVMFAPLYMSNLCVNRCTYWIPLWQRRSKTSRARHG